MVMVLGFELPWSSSSKESRIPSFVVAKARQSIEHALRTSPPPTTSLTAIPANLLW